MSSRLFISNKSARVVFLYLVHLGAVGELPSTAAAEREWGQSALNNRQDKDVNFSKQLHI